jgi:hypothetical protein
MPSKLNLRKGGPYLQCRQKQFDSNKIQAKKYKEEFHLHEICWDKDETSNKEHMQRNMPG